LDPFTGGAIAVAEAARNLVSVGARPLALTDCLNFGNPERPEIMWQFRECVSGMREACLKLDIPVISGNVSFYNETSGESVYPTPTIGMVGLIDNINLHITHSFKNEGDIILLIGKTEEELGGSEYLKVIHGLERGMPPLLDLEMDNIIQNACLDAVRAGIIKSAHDCSEGGLAVTLAECCMSSSESLGVDITVPPYDIRHDAALFGESQSRMVMCVAEKDIDEFMSIADRYGIPSIILGRVAGKRLRINRLIDIAVDECSKVWKGTIEGYLQ
jgi:phosphoribosylformylglycinamidine synthase